MENFVLKIMQKVVDNAETIAYNNLNNEHSTQEENIMAATLYTLEAVEQTINNWIEAGGEISTVEEGVLGWGLTICHGEGLRTAIIK